MIRPILKGKVINVDVDGVLADMVSLVCLVMEGAGKKLIPGDFTEWDLYKTVGEDYRVYLEHMMSKPSFWRDMPVIVEGVEGVKFMLSQGAEVCFVSSPYTKCKEWEDARREWLQKQGLNSDNFISTKIKHRISGNYFFDDKIENVASWQVLNPYGDAILVAAPYNYRATSIETTKSIFSWLKEKKLV